MKNTRTNTNRRRFLLSCAGLGSAVLVPSLFGRKVLGAGDSCKKQPFIVTVHFGGGWDPTILCDPLVDSRFNSFAEGDISSAGQINYAPRVDGGLYEFNGQDFFQKHYQRICLINGVDTQTASHEVGARFTITGTQREGLPSLSALSAGLTGAGLPLALMTNRSTPTQGLAPLTKMGGALDKVIFPNNINDSKRWIDEPVDEVIRRRLLEADGGVVTSIHAPLRRTNAEAVQASRGPQTEELFSGVLDGIDAIMPAPSNQVAEGARTALGAMRAGACVAAHLGAGGEDFFLDTHSNHFPSHSQVLGRYLEGVDYLIDAAESDPIISKRGLVVYISSDFGRTTINADSGKDHWAVTSLMTLTAGSARGLLPGNRVVGKTAASIEGNSSKGALAYPIKVVDGEIQTTNLKDEHGYALTPAHVHLALRKKLGLCDDHLVEKPLNQFAIRDVEEETPPIFG